MRRNRRRSIHYSVSSLHDGTVLAAFPIRKPSDRIMKRDHRRMDADHVCVEYPGAGKELSDVRYENRTRFQDIIATALNTKRILRELILPEIHALSSEIAAIRAKLDHMERLAEKSARDQSPIKE